MDRSEVITLVATTQAQNEFGVWTDAQTTKDVFCQVDSVTRAEFFEGGRNGLNPQFRFTMFFGDYEGERTVIYKGNAYSVYRTYQGRKSDSFSANRANPGRGDSIELYVERKGGSNVAQSTD